VSTSSYGYTADGRLAWRKEGAAAREWLIYDGAQAVVQIQQPSQGVGALTWTHVWAGSRLVRTTSHGTPSATYVPHQDRLGSIVLLRTVGDGSLERKLYDPYGRVVAAPGGSTAGPLPIPFGYAGARWEAPAGLYQMGARWYDPELGRFLEQDPIGEAGGLNLYAYVGSSPTLWVDPTGLAAEFAMSSANRQAKTNPTYRAPARVGSLTFDRQRDDSRLSSNADTPEKVAAEKEQDNASKEARKGNDEDGLYSIIVNFKSGAASGPQVDITYDSEALAGLDKAEVDKRQRDADALEKQLNESALPVLLKITKELGKKASAAVPAVINVVLTDRGSTKGLELADIGAGTRYDKRTGAIIMERTQLQEGGEFVRQLADQVFAHEFGHMLHFRAGWTANSFGSSLQDYFAGVWGRSMETTSENRRVDARGGDEWGGLVMEALFLSRSAYRSAESGWHVSSGPTFFTAVRPGK
jgi:RHS repeat-associated protein